jgi:uncharacterized protein YfaS (alpha-2-macroglobulin family)
MYSRPAASPVPSLWFLVMLLIIAGLLLPGCGSREEPSPDNLGPDDLMVASTLPASAELTLGRSLGVRLVRGNSEWGFFQDMAAADAATIEPDIEGHWAWNDGARLEFHPRHPYDPNTRYRVTLKPAAFARHGLKLRGPRQFDFTAAAFRCLRIELERERVGYRPPRYRVQGSLHFNYPVDPEDAARHLKGGIEGQDPVALVMETTGAGTRLDFRSEVVEADRQDRSFVVRLDKELKPAEGGLGLDKARSGRVVIPALERLQISRLTTGSSDLKPTISIRFNEEVSPTELRKHLKLEPAVDDLTMTSNWNTVVLAAAFQPKQSYTVSIAGALQASNGLALEVDFSRRVTIPDLDPMARIAGPGNYLSLRGEGKVALETLNLEKIQVVLQRIYPNNLVPFLQKSDLRRHSNHNRWRLEDLGVPLFQQEITLRPGPVNQMQLVAVDLGSALEEDSRGIFRLQLFDPESNRWHDGRWIVATDLGLVAKRTPGRVEVAVASISKLSPVQGATVRLLSRNNQEVASGRTNAEGHISFSGLDDDTPGQRPFVVVATLGDDLSFLAFDETAVRTADLDVGGVHLTEKGYRAFMYGDRDIYRPGETMHLAWMVRDSKLKAAPSLPLNLVILGPGGDRYTSLRTECDEAGCGQYSAVMPRWVRTGPYTAMLYLGENQLLGETQFSVEEFIPDRMKVTASLHEDAAATEPVGAVVGPDAELHLRAEAVSLFGPPAAGRTAEADIWFRRTPVVMPGYEAFHFGENLGDELPPQRSLARAVTNEQGEAGWEVPLPSAPDFQGWLRLTANVKVSELGGGRAVSSTVATNYSPLDRVLGVRSLDSDGSDYREPGQPVSFEAVLLDLAGRPQADPEAKLQLRRRKWRTVLKQDSNGDFRYVSEYDEELVQEQAAALQAGPTTLTVTPEAHGRYRLVVLSGDGQVRGSVDFYVYGFGYAPWAMSNPEKVNLKLDRENYGVGDVVMASVEAPFPGLMLVTVEREKVFSKQWVRLRENTGTVQVRVPAGASPNVYLTATLLRPLSELDPRTPARAFGAVPVFIDRDRRTLPVELETVAEMRPGQPLTVGVKLPEDMDPQGAPPRLTVAVVDEGVLQLTGYTTPSALDHFLQRRRLAVQSHDIWSLLLPEFSRIKRKSATGGDAQLSAADRDLAKRLNPLAANRVKPVALWSGLLEGKAGWQQVTFDIPQFNGSLRVMAVATADDRFGSAESNVKVADPLVLTPSLPRFAAPGDRFQVPVPVYNGLPADAGPSAAVDLKLKLSGPLQPAAPAPGPLTVAAGKEEVAWFELAARDTVGTARIEVLASAAGETVSSTTELAVRPAHPLASRVTSGAVQGGNENVQSVRIADDWLPGTAVTSISVAGNPAAGFGAALPYLLRYPYGCLEQKTSRCFPLIHFGELATKLAPGEFGENDGDYFVNSGLDYLATLYRPGLGFVMWPGAGYESHNPFATVYATHFLVEADQAGYVVPRDILEDALQVVAGLARTSSEGWPSAWVQQHRLATRAYACYVLALADKPERGAMDQLVQGDWQQLALAARTHLAGAYALTGNRPRFEELLPAANAPAETGRSSGFSWYSPARDEAMRLEVLATVDPDHLQVPRLMQRLARRAENGRWYNTQENAFALLALGKLSARGLLEPASGSVLVDGEVVGTFSGDGFSIQSRRWAGATIEIRAEGPGTAWYSILDEGVPTGADVEDFDGGLVIQRTYLDTSGNPLDLQNIEQGQTIVCRLVLQSDKGRVDDVVISDLVPAGLEIENPRLSRDSGYEWIEERDLRQFGRLGKQHLEIRDDRLLLFTGAGTKPAAFHYTLRAVTAGQFTLPPVRAEAMYDPEVMSTRGAGAINVVRP